MDLRKIDMLMAEKMFGIKYAWDDEWQQYGREDPEDCMCFLVCPHYSADIAAAWRVVEKLQARAESAEVYLRQSYDGVWMCSFFGKGSVQYQGTAHADTAPLAVSLAALAALGVEVPDAKSKEET